MMYIQLPSATDISQIFGASKKRYRNSPLKTSKWCHQNDDGGDDDSVTACETLSASSSTVSQEALHEFDIDDENNDIHSNGIVRRSATDICLQNYTTPAAVKVSLLSLSGMEQLVNTLSSSHGKHHEKVGLALYVLGVKQYKQGNIQQACQILQHSLQCADYGSQKLADCHYYLGLSYFKLGDLPESLDHCSLALEMHELLDQQSGLHQRRNVAKIHTAIGHTWRAIGDERVARDSFSEARAILEQ